MILPNRVLNPTVLNFLKYIKISTRVRTSMLIVKCQNARVIILYNIFGNKKLLP